MKRVSQILLSFAVCYSIVLGVFSPATAADDTVHSARRLPSRVYAYLSIRNTTELKEKFNESLLGQMLAQPELETVRENVLQVLKEKASQFEERAGITLDELLSIPQGEIAIAAIQPPGKKLAPVALLDFGEKGDLVKKLLDKLADVLQDQEAERSTEDFQDSEIVMFKSGADGDGSSKVDLAYCLKDQVLVVGQGTDTIKTVLSRWDGQHDNTLMSNEVFRYLVKKCSTENSEAPPLINWYIDPLGLLQAIMNSNPQGAAQMGMVVGMLPVLGLDKLKAVGGAMEIGTGEFDSISRTLVYIEQPTSGLMNVFKFPSDVQTPPAWVTKDTSSFSAINWDISKAYSSVETLIDTFRGPGALAMQLDEISDSQFQGDLHLKKDVLDLLTGKVRMISDVPDSDKPESSRSLVALEVKNSADAEATLAKIATLEGFPGETREFRGKTIYEFPASGALAARFNQNPNEEDEEKMIGVAVVHDHLMVAMDVTLLERVMRGDPDAQKLSDSESYKEVAKHFPEKTSIVNYTKDDSEVKTVYELLRSGNTGFLLGGAFDDIDFTQLPEFETISRFLPPSGSFMIPDERGLLLQSFTTKKVK